MHLGACVQGNNHNSYLSPVPAVCSLFLEQAVRGRKRVYNYLLTPLVPELPFATPGQGVIPISCHGQGFMESREAETPASSSRMGPWQPG